MPITATATTSTLRIGRANQAEPLARHEFDEFGELPPRRFRQIFNMAEFGVVGSRRNVQGFDRAVQQLRNHVKVREHEAGQAGSGSRHRVP